MALFSPWYRICTFQKEINFEELFWVQNWNTFKYELKISYKSFEQASCEYTSLKSDFQQGKIWKGHKMCGILSTLLCKNMCVSALWVCKCVCVCVRACVCVPVWDENITKKHFYSLLRYSQFSFLSVCPKPSQSRLHKEKFETHFLSYCAQTS